VIFAMFGVCFLVSTVVMTQVKAPGVAVAQAAQ